MHEHATNTSRRPTYRRRGLVFTTAAMVSVLAVITTGCTAAFTAIPGVPNCTITPANSFWRSKVASLSVLPKSGQWINTIGANAGLKADFGSGLWLGEKIGIPYTIIPGTQPLVSITGEYSDSDHGQFPIPPSPNIEGGGDKHILLVDKDNCKLYETWNSVKVSNSLWSVGSAIRWDLKSNTMRAAGATSADAAGLQILPGLVRYEEVASGTVRHAIRMTIPTTAGSYVWPASHVAGSNSAYPPMGSWFRLRASTININNFDPAVRPIIVALETYGAVIADNGSAFYMSGVPDERWDNSKLQTLGQIKGSQFDVVDASIMKVANGSYQSNTAS